METTDNLKEAIRELTTTGQQLAVPNIQRVEFTDSKGEPHSVPVAFVASGHGVVKPVSLLEFISAARHKEDELRLASANGPDRRRGTATHQTLDSFISHMNRFKDANSAVWASARGDDQKAKLVGIFNYHLAGSESPARWGDHRAEYPCPTSGAWAEWGAGTQRTFDQEEFAEFLEARDFDLATGTLTTGTNAPTPAHMVTMANRLEVFSSATAKRERDPQTQRVRISFTEDKGVSGDILPPPVFLIAIPVFMDSEPERMEVRLRVTIEGAKAKFTVQIHNADAIWRKSFEKVCLRVIEATELPVYQGTPE